jgi:pimeloyl-ACP methyl ester carboxylesterase
MVIVAHSMGGLISRFALNQHLVNTKENFIKLLVTISTPWQGHRAAAFGVKQSPLVIPSWYDMVADSPFLKSIHRTALPPEVEYDLFFGYRGDANRNGELGDGTVLLSSMLDADMQKAATRIYGFDADHRNILTSQEVVQQLNQILVKAFQGD